MESEILYQPSYSLARVRLNTGEAITAEAGAMVSMSEGITIETSVKGGISRWAKAQLSGWRELLYEYI